MALIRCSECSSEVSDKAVSCPKCGNPIFSESKIVIYGYTQMFAITIKVQVFWNGESIGISKKGDKMEFPIDQDGILKFKAQMRTAELNIKAGKVTNVKVSFDRISGKMIPQIVDVVTPKN